MSNDASGIMKVVAKDKMTLERLKKIMDYDDSEFCLYRMKDCQCDGEAYEDGDFWVQDFYIDGAWSCEPFLNYGDKPDTKLCVGYEKDENGREDFTKKIYGTAHFTDLSHLAKVLGFGAMFWTTEPGMMFAERGVVHKDGSYEYDTESYELKCPMNEEGDDIDYDTEPEEICGFGDEFKEWLFADEIYGEGED